MGDDYEFRIARDRNVKQSGIGCVIRFEVESDVLIRYPVQQADGRTILELRVPAEELDDCNAHVVGDIQVVHDSRRGEAEWLVRRSPLGTAERRGAVRWASGRPAAGASGPTGVARAAPPEP